MVWVVQRCRPCLTCRLHTHCCTALQRYGQMSHPHTIFLVNTRRKAQAVQYSGGIDYCWLPDIFGSVYIHIVRRTSGAYWQIRLSHCAGRYARIVLEMQQITVLYKHLSANCRLIYYVSDWPPFMFTECFYNTEVPACRLALWGNQSRCAHIVL